MSEHNYRGDWSITFFIIALVLIGVELFLFAKHLNGDYSATLLILIILVGMFTFASILGGIASMIRIKAVSFSKQLWYEHGL